jgi:hypothetical protein
MKKAKTQRSSRAARKASRPSKRAQDQLLLRRISALEDAVDSLLSRQLHGDGRVQLEGRKLASLRAAQDRFVRATSDGWLLVLASGTKTSLPSGLKVSLTNTTGGRDYGVVLEGVLAGTTFDVSAGNLETSFKRVDALTVTVKKRAGGPLEIGGVKYELEVNISYTQGGAQKTIGPFAATTDSNNPVPSGQKDIEIPDAPHAKGLGYSAHSTVWFRIGHEGDRYVHAGQISAGCLTCAPKHWEDIYAVLHCARDGTATNVGKLVVQ